MVGVVMACPRLVVCCEAAFSADWFENCMCASKPDMVWCTCTHCTQPHVRLPHVHVLHSVMSCTPNKTMHMHAHTHSHVHNKHD